MSNIFKRLLLLAIPAIIIGLLMAFAVSAQVSSPNFWNLISGYLKPVSNNYGLQIPKLGSSGSPCLVIGATGIFATSTCGSGSSGATTTITSNTTVNGPTFIFSTSTVGTGTLKITGSGSTILFALDTSGLQNTLTLPLSVANGGTGGTSWTAGNILFGNGAGTIATSSLFTFTAAGGLTVNATSTLATTTTGSLTVTGSTTISSLTAGLVQSTATGNLFISNQLGNGSSTGLTVSGVAFFATTTNSGTLTVTGNVGIGTTGPNYQLSLGNNNANTKLAIYQGDAGISFGLGAQAYQFRFNLANTASRFSFLDSEAGNNELVTIKGTGNVGIGTTGPSYKLHVLNSAGGSATVVAEGSAGAEIGFGWAKTGASPALKWQAYVPSNSDNLSFYTADLTDRIVFTRQGNIQLDGALSVDGTGDSYISGNVGIGTTTPSQKLQVNGSAILGSSGNTIGTLLFANSSNSYTTTLQSSSTQATNLTFTLPMNNGTAGQVLATDGAGFMSWQNAPLAASTTEWSKLTTFDKSFTLASTTPDYLGNSFSTATYTIISLWNPSKAVTLKKLYCKTNVGTLLLNFGGNLLSCTSTGASSTPSINFAIEANVPVSLGSGATSPADVTVTTTWINQ